MNGNRNGHSVKASMGVYERAQRVIPGVTQLLSRRPTRAALGVSPSSRLLPRPLDPPGAASRLPTAALKLDEPLAAIMIYRSDMVDEHINNGGPRFLPDAITGTPGPRPSSCLPPSPLVPPAIRRPISAVALELDEDVIAVKAVRRDLINDHRAGLAHRSN